MLKISLYFFLDIFQHVFKIVYQFVLLSCGAECEYCCYCCSCTLIFFMLRQLVYLLFKFCFTKFCHPKFCNFAYNFWILSFKFLFLTSKKFSFCFFFLFLFCFCKFVVLNFTPRENYPNMAERLQFCSLVFRFIIVFVIIIIFGILTRHSLLLLLFSLKSTIFNLFKLNNCVINKLEYNS